MTKYLFFRVKSIYREIGLKNATANKSAAAEGTTISQKIVNMPWVLNNFGSSFMTTYLMAVVAAVTRVRLSA